MEGWKVTLSAMLKIAIVGPESSGKTTLCKALAMHYQAPWVPEFAREYLGERGGAYTHSDLLRIAEGQCAQEERAAGSKPSLLLCDTDIVTIRIWNDEKYSAYDRRTIDLSERHHYDHWLLCRPDLPWEPDPLRENPHDRDRLFAVYEDLLKRLAKPFSIIAGDAEQRMRTATAVIDALLPPKG